MENIVPKIEDDSIDFSQIWRQVRNGFARTLGLACIGLALGAIGYVATYPVVPTRTTSRVVLSFPGFERGQYPDKTKFQAEDIIAVEILDAALNKLGIDVRADLQGDIRSGLSIEGIIPTAVVTDRDRLRNAGQNPPAYLPDEYRLTLSLKRKFDLNSSLREQLLHEIVIAYRERFTRTYAELPQSLGNAFQALKNADYFEYEIVLTDEMQKLVRFLRHQADNVRSFRSGSTNLSYSDLISQTETFSQIQLNAVLGIIRVNGISRDRSVAMIKMDYYLRTLEERQVRAEAEEKVVLDLLEKAQQRSQNYVLGIKSSGQNKGDSPVVDQGLLDSLLSNDAYNFLVRRALDAGLAVKSCQAEKAELIERRKNMQAFIKSGEKSQGAELDKLKLALTELQDTYAGLIRNVQATHVDYARQFFANAARESMAPHTESYYRGGAEAAVVGAIVGSPLGLGLSLLGGGSRKN